MASDERPFDIDLQLIPGKGHTSYSDAVERIDIRLTNVSNAAHLVQRSDTLPVDDAFETSTNVQLWDAKGTLVAVEDFRPQTDRAIRAPTEESFQVVAPGTSIYLSSFVIRKPKGKKSLVATFGAQTFNNLNPGSYTFQFSWSMGGYGADVASALAKTKKTHAPWVGEVQSSKFKFKIVRKADGSFDCEG